MKYEVDEIKKGIRGGLKDKIQGRLNSRQKDNWKFVQMLAIKDEDIYLVFSQKES